MIKNKKILKGLDHTQYEHPFDQKALSTLQSTPGVDLVGNFITKHTIEKIYTVQYTGSNLKVTSENYPKIYEYLQYACQILDLPKVPELYIEWGYSINAFTVGSENPIIVLNSGLIDLCDDDEIMFIIGHECGHIKSNHMLYHMMAQVINICIDSIPFGSIAAAPLQYALYYWDRMSEFTADRAGLLCCQNKAAAIRAFMKMAGMPIKEFNNMNYQTFIQQATEFKQLDYDAMSKVIKFISIADNSHPWTVMRAAELLNWINSSEYNKFNLGETSRLIVDESPKVITRSSDQKMRKNKYLGQ
ncbi:M48 family metallopeptidase [Parabacteroides pacaensis]|uniref:M48 family metallopeptidase n=1 Tax=Parabacteroides pacaensis TaxID=2086575 RepID=UPI000D0F3B71|nr:M48 family metallopeptidase [Parabacteroides pacaensis]